MQSVRKLAPAAAAFVLIAFLATDPARGGSRAVAQADQTALDRYVAAPDPSYRYQVARTVDGDGFRAAAIDLTSQTWLTDKEVDRPVWRHWLLVVVPKEVRSTTGMLFIGGGANGRPAPEKPDGRLVQIARATMSVVAELRTVPNQPLTFVGDGKPRVEDEMIAYTWDRYLHTGDEKWPARLPMTKAAVRAMDTVTDFCATDAGGKVKIDRFVVAGASKRGWTTWSTAAVDDRVVAIVPIVIDTLNVEKSAAHHMAAYGFFAPALRDYEEMGIERWAGKPEYAALLRIEDPYSYRARYTMPKLMLNATGDQYFLPDNSQLYFDDLPGEKYLRYVPNTDHSLKDSDAAETLLAFYGHILAGAPLPKLSWTLEKDGSILVKTGDDEPADVKLWQATNPAARDFRLESLGAKWTSAGLPQDEQGVYLAQVGVPAKGWTAFFVELTYAGKGGAPPLKLTTQVRVVPDVLPFAERAKGLEPAAAARRAAGGYAVVVSKATADDPQWAPVVDALLKKHGGERIVSPKEATRQFVADVHRLTRKLDDEPYADTIWASSPATTPATPCGSRKGPSSPH